MLTHQVHTFDEVSTQYYAPGLWEKISHLRRVGVYRVDIRHLEETLFIDGSGNLALIVTWHHTAVEYCTQVKVRHNE